MKPGCLDYVNGSYYAFYNGGRSVLTDASVGNVLVSSANGSQVTVNWTLVADVTNQDVR